MLILRLLNSRTSTATTSVNAQPTNNAYAYDLSGNLLSDGHRAFDYDDENQLIRVTMTNAWKSEYTYDGKMRRRITKEFTWNGSSWSQTNEIHYIYDGNLVVQEQDANNKALVSYTRGNDLSGKFQGAGGIGGLLARTDNSQALYISMIARRGYPPPPAYATTAHAYYHADGNGNVMALINASQMIVAKYLYDPFGNTLAQSGLLADANAYRFSSKEWNNNAGLYYYLYRLYDPSLERWMNRDPLEELGGVNLYKFVLDNPISNIDALGLRCVCPDLNDPNSWLSLKIQKEKNRVKKCNDIWHAQNKVCDGLCNAAAQQKCHDDNQQELKNCLRNKNRAYDFDDD